MPKRSAEEKLAHYQRKIKKLQESVKRKRNIIDSSDGENIIEEPIYYAESNTVLTDEIFEQPIDKPESQRNEPDLALLEPHPASEPILEQTVAIDPHITTAPSVAPVPSPDTPPEPSLDPELLSALGACTSDTPDFGESVHSSLANLWLPLLRKGVCKDDKENLTKEYLIPQNCKLLQAPKLNAEISAAVSDVVRGRDKKLTSFQQQLGAGISAINRGMDTILISDNRALALKKLSDACRLLSDLHYCFTKDRIKLLTPSLEKNILHVIQDTERDDTLFGNTLAEKIKACKAIEKQGNQIRNKANQKSAAPQTSASRLSHQGNWTGPPRYPSNRGGRGGRGRTASTAVRRTYPSITAQTTKGSSQLKPRAQH